MTARCWLVLLVLVGLVVPSLARAHKPSDSYLTLSPHGRSLTGHWDIALRDLDRALTLDADGDGALRWGELRAREHEVARYALSHLALAQGAQACALTAQPLSLITHSDGGYVRLPLRAHCGADADTTLRYQLFFALDPQHRAVVRLGADPQRAQTYVLTAQKRTLPIQAAAAASAESARSLVGQGIDHILSGLDHVLFLLALLLPAVLRRGPAGQTPAAQLRRVAADVAGVVTAFTVAHSLTLALAALGLVSVSADVIEPAIAASVAIAALDNLWPVLGPDRWSIAFALGLLHGFGFSSALADLGLTGGALLEGLLAFNAGVELGQLAIVLVVVPVAFLLRHAWFYRWVGLRAGSLAIAAISLVWFYERVMGG
jgi:hypothetical protein